MSRGRRRRALLGLQTVLGLRRRGFFIPYRYAATLPGPGERPPYAPVARVLDAAHDRFADVLDMIDRYAADLGRIGGEPPPAPRFDQDWFPGLDAAAAYVLVRSHRPRRIVEVGSGHSTRFLARAVADGGGESEITAIDPAPRAVIEGLPVQIVRHTLHEAGEAVFSTLGPGDVLFIDSSHILMPGSDVDALFNRVLPLLPVGTLVHIHDIFLPDDYPPAWEWRGYNEQLAVVPLLTGGAWQPVFASHYVRTRMADRVAEGFSGTLPVVPATLESSLWLRRTRVF